MGVRDLTRAALGITRMSRWIDDANRHRDPEARTWGRLAKIQEEAGEVVAAFIGLTGQNPRKGYTHTVDQLKGECLDVALTALGAWDHLDGNRARSLDALADHIARVLERADLEAEPRPFMVAVSERMVSPETRAAIAQAAKDESRRCPACRGLESNHNAVHERNPEGGGGWNRPCPLDPRVRPHHGGGAK